MRNHDSSRCPTGDHETKVGVVIVTYNSSPHLERALRSLSGACSHSLDVVVVDNHSTDDTTEVVREVAPHVRLLINDQNLGFARACNVGAATTDADLLLFLNPDSELDPGSLDRAVRRLTNDPTIGLVGGRTRYEDGSLNPTCCFGRPSLWSAICYASGLASIFRSSRLFNPEAMGGWDRSTERDVDVVTGCFLLMRTELFKYLGGFDERFFLYSEDTDLAERVRALGLRCVHMHDVGLVHVGGGSDVVASDKLVKVFRARRQYYAKHWSPIAAVVGGALLDLAVLGRLAATRPGAAQRNAKWKAVWQSRSLWHDITPVPEGAALSGEQLFPGPTSTLEAPVISPPVRLDPRPVEHRARIAYRVGRHVARSLRSGDFDFVGQGLSTAVRLPLLAGADLAGKPEHECNVCGWVGRAFYPNTGPGYHEQGVTCPGCSSQDRHRSLLALLLTQTDLFGSRSRVVEVAPMRGFEALLRAQPDLTYTSFDLERHAMERGDITAMRYATASVDYFLCFHVLEHIPDDHGALKEIRRVLRPGGTAVLQVPIDWGADDTREYEAPDPRDVGHVRRYGLDFADRVTSAGFIVSSASVIDALPAATVARFGLSPEPIYFARKPSGG